MFQHFGGILGDGDKVKNPGVGTCWDPLLWPRKRCPLKQSEATDLFKKYHHLTFQSPNFLCSKTAFPNSTKEKNILIIIINLINNNHLRIVPNLQNKSLDIFSVCCTCRETTWPSWKDSSTNFFSSSDNAAFAAVKVTLVFLFLKSFGLSGRIHQYDQVMRKVGWCVFEANLRFFSSNPIHREILWSSKLQTLTVSYNHWLKDRILRMNLEESLNSSDSLNPRLFYGERIIILHGSEVVQICSQRKKLKTK